MSLKLISLNTWGGRAGEEKLLSFFKEHKDNVDIFCLQEIWRAPYPNHEGNIAGGRKINHDEIMTEGLQKISTLLEEFIPHFRPHHGDDYGLLTLTKKNLKVIKEGEEFVFKHKGFTPTGDVGGHARNIQYVTLEKGSRSFSVLNFHGLWTGKGKGDTDERIEQSKKILKLVDSLPSSFLISGDFNLSLKTKSVELLESHGMKNLIKDFNITSTRTSFYTRPEKFADYIFTSPEIKVIDFKVLPHEVSDHSPLYIEFDIP